MSGAHLRELVDVSVREVQQRVLLVVAQLFGLFVDHARDRLCRRVAQPLELFLGLAELAAERADVLVVGLGLLEERLVSSGYLHLRLQVDLRGPHLAFEDLHARSGCFGFVCEDFFFFSLREESAPAAS